MKKLKEVDLKILAGLMKNAKISDRKLAENIGVSQPTITRRRAFLEEKLSLEYTAIPDLPKLGMNILAFHFLRWNTPALETLDSIEGFKEKLADHLLDQPNMIFTSSGQGLGTTSVSITFHRNYADLVDYLLRIKSGWGAYLSKYDTFLVSLKSDRILRQLALKHLAEYIQTAKRP